MTLLELWISSLLDLIFHTEQENKDKNHEMREINMMSDRFSLSLPQTWMDSLSDDVSRQLSTIVYGAFFCIAIKNKSFIGDFEFKSHIASFHCDSFFHSP
jgi:hypothetical protein